MAQRTPAIPETESEVINDAMAVITEIKYGKAELKNSLLNRARLAVEEFILSREPKWVPTITTLVCVSILFGLGTWQMVRLDQKNKLLQQVQAQFRDTPADLRSQLPVNDAAWKKLDYHNVLVTGTWMPAVEFKLAPRTYESQVGYQLIRPLRLASNQIVFVNLGFVPEKTTVLPADSAPVQLMGIAHVPLSERPEFVPENVPSRGSWVWSDLTAMAHEVGVADVAPVMIYENRVTDRDTYPIGGQLPLPLHNRHWHYAVTWYALALSLIGVWMIASSPKQVDTTTAAPAAPTEDLSDPVARRGRYPEATD
jgi:surfeit locus 1 family protein